MQNKNLWHILFYVKGGSRIKCCCEKKCFWVFNQLHRPAISMAISELELQSLYYLSSIKILISLCNSAADVHHCFWQTTKSRFSHDNVIPVGID